MNNQELSREIENMLPGSRVFPDYIKVMLLRSMDSLSGNQLELLQKILNEEKGKMSELKKEFNINS